MSEKLSIDLNSFQHIFFVKLQHLLDILAVSLAGLERVNENPYEGFIPFFAFVPEESARLSSAAAVTEAKRWYLCTTFRDAIEITNELLEECLVVCMLCSLSYQSTISTDDYNHVVNTQRKKLHNMGLPDKLKKLQNTFGVVSIFNDHVLSINKARNCLVHRRGIVADQDIDKNGELVILLRSIDIIAKSSDGSQEIELVKPTPVEAGWTTEARLNHKKKIFRKGERIELAYPEIIYTFFSLAEFVKTITVSVNSYRKLKGIRDTKSTK